MNRIASLRPGILLALLVTLNACTGVAVKLPEDEQLAANRERAEQLATMLEWGFVGKISLDDGDEGGSGRLQWDVNQDVSVLDFHAAMGRGAWHLDFGPQGATLKEADGVVRTATTVNTLIQDRMGWPIPVDALQWWVRGLAAPDAIEAQQLDSEGRMAQLQQLGWSVIFKRYSEDAGIAMPVRLEATRADYRVKLAISRWHLNPGAGE